MVADPALVFFWDGATLHAPLWLVGSIGKRSIDIGAWNEMIVRPWVSSLVLLSWISRALRCVSVILFTKLKYDFIISYRVADFARGTDL